MSWFNPQSFFFEDDCPILTSSMEWKLYKSEEVETWEDAFLHIQTWFRKLVEIEKGEKPPPQKKMSNQVNPILCDTSKKAKEEFEVIEEDEDDSI